ncbi:MAG: hypothetical protein ILO42_08975, partial [Clostridia bacterium]|nr:hypothetical protein [Clostridia bacterium]
MGNRAGSSPVTRTILSVHNASELGVCIFIMIIKQLDTYLHSKKILIRDTFIVLIPTCITIAYLIVVVIM